MNLTYTKDSLDLLQECEKGVKMAVASIDEVLSMVKNETLKEILKESKAHHEKIRNKADSLVREMGKDGDNPPIMAKFMSQAKIDIGYMMKSTDEEIAKLIYDGSNMGIRSIYEYLNKLVEADDKCRDIAYEIISEEEDLMEKLKNFL